MTPSSPLARFRLGSAAALALAVACSGSDLLLPSASQPAAIALAAGDGQSGVAGGILPESLAVRITDAADRPAAQVRVAFTPGAGGGQTKPDTAVTDNTGRAAAQWVLGAQAGTYKVKASVVGSTQLTTSFTATVLPTTASALFITTQPSASAVVGQALAQQPQIQLRDNQGKPVAQAGIAVTAAIASGPTGGTLSGQLTQATDANGLATFTDLALSAIGTYTLGFSGASLATVTSAQISVNGGAPSASRSSVPAAPAPVTAAGRAAALGFASDACSPRATPNCWRPR